VTLGFTFKHSFPEKLRRTKLLSLFCLILNCFHQQDLLKMKKVLEEICGCKTPEQIPPHKTGLDL